RAERGRDQGLRFSAGEDSRTMGPREHADFAGDRAELAEAAPVDAFSLQNEIAHDALLKGLKGFRNLLRRVSEFSVGGQELIADAVAQFTNSVGTILFAGCLLAFPEFIIKALAKNLFQRVGRQSRRGWLGLQPSAIAELFDEVDQLNNMLVGEENCLQHVL